MSAKKAVEKIDHMIHIESVWSRALKSNSEWPDKVKDIKANSNKSNLGKEEKKIRNKTVNTWMGRSKQISLKSLECNIDQEEFLDVIYWSRQALGIIIGLIWGLIPLKGFVALLLFVVVNAGVIYLYFSSYQSVDEEEYGGAWELTKEGFMTSFAGFLVTWIIIYSGLHFD